MHKAKKNTWKNCPSQTKKTRNKYSKLKKNLLKDSTLQDLNRVVQIIKFFRTKQSNKNGVKKILKIVATLQNALNKWTLLESLTIT